MSYTLYLAGKIKIIITNSLLSTKCKSLILLFSLLTWLYDTTQINYISKLAPFEAKTLVSLSSKCEGVITCQDAEQYAHAPSQVQHFTKQILTLKPTPRRVF